MVIPHSFILINLMNNLENSSTMKKLVISSIPLIFVCLLLSCKEKTEGHKHGPDTHTHEEKSKDEVATNYYGEYELEDAKFGTKTMVTIIAKERIMITNSLPNHITGEFPNEGNPNTISEQNRTFKFPLIPKYTGKAEWIREPGIALNGIKFEPGTGEVVVCESGENYRIEALQDVFDLGLDVNHAHVQPNGAYHYHGTPTAVIEDLDTGEDLIHIGFAHDGFPMYYSKSNAYKPSFKLLDGSREGEDCSYSNPKQTIVLPDVGHHDGTFGSDFEYVDGSGDLDECNGITVDGKYMYVVTNEFPYVGRCLMGEFESQERGGPPPGARQGGRGLQPNIDEVFKEFDSNADGKISVKESKGPMHDKFREIDGNGDGYLSKEELENDMTLHKQQGRRS